jgi:hypothetical protein
MNSAKPITAITILIVRAYRTIAYFLRVSPYRVITLYLIAGHLVKGLFLVNIKLR